MNDDGPHAETYLIDIGTVLEDVLEEIDPEAVKVLEAEPADDGQVRVVITEQLYHERHGLTLDAVAETLRDRIEGTEKGDK